MIKKLSLTILTVMLASAFVTCPASAAETEAAVPQDQGTVTGTVSDAAGQGVIGAFVVVKGTQTGASTDLDGKFVLDKVASGAVLEITCIGYKSQEVVWNGGPVALTLVADNAMLDEVVVTALGISREKKSLGYAVQDVKSEMLTRGGEVSLTDALQGKVAGLQITSSSTGVGGSTNVVIRGNSSLSDNNAPLYVVDGVPYDSKQTTDSHANLWGGNDRAGGAFDINPEDIQSVSVLKGPTAAALYGSRAGNGVILITTKKGGLNDQGRWGVSYSGKVSFSPIAYYLDIQNQYGQGLDGEYSSNSDTAWGALLGSGTTPAWYDKTKSVPYVDNGDAMKQFYNVGFTQSHNLTVAGGKKDNPFRLTIGYDDTKGVVPGNDINKTSIDVVDKLTVNKWLSFDVKANYIHTVGYNRPNLGFYSTTWNILQIPRNISMADLDKYWVNDEIDYKQQNWYGPNPNTQNPYWIIRQEHNRDVKDRLFGIITANVKFTDHLFLKLKQGLDYSSTEDKKWYLYNDVSFVGRPSMEITRKSGRELNSEALLTYTNKWGDWDFGANIGGNIMNNKLEGLNGLGESAIMGASFIALGTKQKASNSVYEKQINSLYAFVNVGYKNWLFVDLTARNDWSSTLPPDNRSYFYPSASVSFLLNGIFDAYGVSYDKNVLDLGKIRFSVAQVGKDTEPYQLLNTWGAEVDAFGNLYPNVATSRANANLKPEIATSYEVGTEWHFFQNRLGFDITYYKTLTKNQVMAITQPYSTGYQTAYKNVGEISNEGVEIMLNGDFIRTRHLTFGAVVNFAHNVSKVNKLAEGVSMYSLGQLNGSASTFQVIAKEGEKLGLLYDYGYKTDDKGRIIVSDKGLPLTSDGQKILGCIQPDFTGSLGLYLDYKGFGLNAMFNFQKGGDIFSVTEYELAKKGVAGCTANRADMIVEGVTESGQPNTVKVSAQEYWKNANVERFIYDASYIKLQELSLSYNFPRKLIQNENGRGLDHLKLSIYGTNLFYFLKNTPGTTPDGSSATATMFGSAIDMIPIPNTRNFGLSLNIGF